MITDIEDRNVYYTYSGDNIHTFTNLRGYTTTHGYSGGKLSRFERAKEKERKTIEAVKLVISINSKGVKGYIFDIITRKANLYWKYTRYEIYEARRYIRVCFGISIGECGSTLFGPYPDEEYRATGKKDWVERDFQPVPESEVPENFKYYNPYYDP